MLRSLPKTVPLVFVCLSPLEYDLVTLGDPVLPTTGDAVLVINGDTGTAEIGIGWLIPFGDGNEC